MRLEIVTHCWSYSRLLTYQLSSLVLNPPTNLDVRMTVFYTGADSETKTVLDFFGCRPVPRVEWNWCLLPPEQLFRRSIGRNQAALNTCADWVWFADADYCFGENCLNSLPNLLETVEGPLAFPRWVLTSKTHELGDSAIAVLNETPRIVGVTDSDYSARKMSRATGGIQIARGEICRRIGYCNGMQRRLRPARQWARCVEDVVFRRSLKTRGSHIPLPSVYRIRHSTCGRDDGGIRL